MNNIQKILMMVGCGSLILLLVSMTFLYWSWEYPFVSNPRAPNGNIINYLGIISLFNVVVCSVGFMLYKDK